MTNAFKDITLCGSLLKDHYGNRAETSVLNVLQQPDKNSNEAVTEDDNIDLDAPTTWHIDFREILDDTLISSAS